MEEAPVVRYFILLVVPYFRVVVPSLRVRISPFYCGIIWLCVWENERNNTKEKRKAIAKKTVNQNMKSVNVPQIKIIAFLTETGLIYLRLLTFSTNQ